MRSILSLMIMTLLIGTSTVINAAEQTIKDTEVQLALVPESKPVIPATEQAVRFVPESECNLSREAAVSIVNKSSLEFHFDILDTKKLIDIKVMPGKTRQFCLEHGHVIKAFTLKANGQESNPLPVRQLLPSAKHLTINVIQPKGQPISYKLELDSHKRRP